MDQNKFFGNVLKLALALVREHWRELLILIALNAGMLIAIRYGMSSYEVSLPGFMLISPLILLNTFFVAAAIHLMLWEYRPDLAEARGIALRAYVAVLIANIALHLAVSVGFIFLFFPGLLALAVFIQAPVIVLAERPGIVNTVEKSAKTAWPLAFPILGIVVCSAMSLMGVLIIAGVISAIVGAFGGEVLGNAVFDGLFSAYIVMLQGVVGTAVYLTLHNSGQKLSWSGGDVVDGPGRLH